jgi:hypothetical protein
MRFRNSGALALLLMAGCASDASGPGSASAGGLRGTTQTLITGQVFGISPAPDSNVVPLRGVEIVVYRVDSIPVDTVPVDTIPVDTLPVDSMLHGGLVLRPFVLDSGMRDTLPVDTMPPDTNPPPPPPPPGCGRTGEVVARVLTRGGGRFRIAGLPQAKYDLKISPAPGAPFAWTFYCGVHLLERHPVDLTIYLPPK